MNLLRPINKKETLENTRNFLNKDLNQYLNLCNANKEILKSPNIDSHFINFDNVDNTNPIILNIIDAQKVLKCISDSMLKCSNTQIAPYKTILISYYVDSLTMLQLAEKIGFASVAYTNTLKNRALIEFAERFKTAQLLNQVSKQIKLIVYDD